MSRIARRAQPRLDQVPHCQSFSRGYFFILVPKIRLLASLIFVLTVAHAAAILNASPPGAYTALLMGAQHATGVGVIEIYDLSR